MWRWKSCAPSEVAPRFGHRNRNELRPEAIPMLIVFGPIRLQLVSNRFDIQAELARRFRLVVAGPFKRPEDQFAFCFGGCDSDRQNNPAGGGGGVSQIWR